MLASLKYTKHKTVATAARSAVPTGEFMTAGFSKTFCNAASFFTAKKLTSLNVSVKKELLKTLFI